MNQRNDNVKLTLLRSNYLLGYFRIDISQLSFEDAIRKGHRKESAKVTAHLLRVFQHEGCQRDNSDHFIDAIISLDSFNQAIGTSDPSAFQDPTHVRELRLQQPVEALNGLHRVSAAKCYLPFNDRWWNVRLLSVEGFEQEQHLSRHVLTSFAHEQKYSDGQIFRYIRLAHRRNQYEEEKKWWARLTITKEKDLRQLLKNQTITDAFDKLLVYAGMWEPLQLGALHRFHGLRCPEELLTYLRHIDNVWSRFETFGAHVDSETVEGLELRAPGNSEADFQEIALNNKVFATASRSDRSQALEILRGVKCIIPSLRTFFENQKYLEPCSQILRRLLGPCEPRRSLEMGFSARYFDRDYFLVQVSEENVSKLPQGVTTVPNHDQKKKLAYIQLWMFCMRNFPAMTDIQPKLDARRNRVEKTKNQALWNKLATLAWNLGFETEAIRGLMLERPEQAQVRELLHMVRPSHTQMVDYEQYVNRIVNILDAIPETPCNTVAGKCFGSSRYPIHLRCGRPYSEDHGADKYHIFLPLLGHNVQRQEVDIDITSLYMKRDFLYAFFGHNIADDITNLHVEDLPQEHLVVSAPTAEFELNQSELQAAEHSAAALDEITRIQNRLYAISGEKDALIADMKTKQDEIAELRDTVEQLRAEVLVANSQLDDRVAQFAQLETEYRTNMTLQEHDEQLSIQKDTSLAELRNQLTNSEQATAGYQKDIQRKDGELLEIRNQISQQQQNISEITNSLKAKDEEIELLKSLNHDRFFKGGVERSVAFRRDHMITGDPMSTNELILESRLRSTTRVTKSKAQDWKDVQWEYRCFEHEVHHERGRTAERIFGYENHDPYLLSLVHIFLDDGFRSNQYWIPMELAQPVIASIPDHFRGLVCNTTTSDGIDSPSMITEPLNKIEKQLLRSMCSDRGVCFVGEVATLHALMSSRTRKRGLEGKQIPKPSRARFEDIEKAP